MPKIAFDVYIVCGVLFMQIYVDCTSNHATNVCFLLFTPAKPTLFKLSVFFFDLHYFFSFFSLNQSLGWFSLVVVISIGLSVCLFVRLCNLVQKRSRITAQLLGLLPSDIPATVLLDITATFRGQSLRNNWCWICMIWQMTFFGVSFLSVLLSALGKRLSVSRLKDFCLYLLGSVAI